MNVFKTLAMKAANTFGGTDRENGMEMIQVVFSIAIAVIMGTMVLAFVTNSINPSLNSVNDQSKSLFSDVSKSILKANTTGVTETQTQNDGTNAGR